MAFKRDMAKSSYEGDLVLASSSARRRQLMTEAGYRFEVVEPILPEDHLHPQDPRVVAESLAYAKARQIADTLERGIVVGADTVVAFENRIIGKAHSAEEAHEILSMLSGTTHQVITGVCVFNARRGERLIGAETTGVVMKKMTDAELEAYVASGEGIGKAGAYAIQETGDRFVERLEGSFTNVVGLPMKLLASYLDVMKKLIYRD